jgi:ABC-type hemin transport system ATPase subunit
MFSSDNGAAIFPDEQLAARRKVSDAQCAMQGFSYMVQNTVRLGMAGLLTS